jgi:hypothetical protein
VRILRKLLDNLGDVWNKLPKEVPFLTIDRGTGTHTMMTVDEGTLYFHSAPFRSGLPQKQSITLKSMTTQELLDIIATMGYIVSLTSEAQEKGLDVHKPFILMEVENVAMGKTLTAFTSNLWRTMYPLYRVLRQAEFDTEQALKQLQRQLADGEWLDFWASFFSIEREPGETDNNFVRRFTMWLFNPKTNNVALKELLAYRLQDTDFDVRDKAPLQFEVYLGTKYLDQGTADLHKIIQESKGAGIEYFLNYVVPTYAENYQLAAADFNGKPFADLATISVALDKALEDSYVQPSEVLQGMTMTSRRAEAYQIPQGNTESCFELGLSELNNPDEGVDALFDFLAKQDSAFAVITVGGTETLRRNI